MIGILRYNKGNESKSLSKIKYLATKLTGKTRGVERIYSLTREVRSAPLFLFKGGFMAYREERIKEYERDLKDLRRRQADAKDESEQKILGNMIGSTEYALFWLINRHERMPGETYRQNKLNYKQRTQYWGAIDHAVSFHNIECPAESEKQPIDTFSMAVEDFLSLLSEREREAYLLTKTALYTHDEAAEEMGISKGSVDQYISRAKEKIENAKSYGLQTSLGV